MNTEARIRGGTRRTSRVRLRVAGVAIASGMVLLASGLWLTVLEPDEISSKAVAARATNGDATGSAASHLHGDCPAAEHRDTRVTGLNPEDIPTLPPDFSFFQVAEDGCSPVRWNPCEPVHYVINPAGAPPTGVADVKEAFRRLAKATGMTYVDDGFTDEDGRGNRAYQPDRYGERWAPVLVHWMASSGAQAGVQIVGGGLPTSVGDVYVTATLALNQNAVTNTETRTTVAGGFDDKVTIGAVGPEGVTWGRIILHELAHVTGLGHVREPSQLMYPETSEQTGPTAFQEGDLAGIKLLGRQAGCLETPRPSAEAAPKGGGGGGGGPTP